MDMRQNYLVEYVPNAYINLCVDKNQQRANNQLIYDFKAGRTAPATVKPVPNHFKFPFNELAIV